MENGEINNIIMFIITLLRIKHFNFFFILVIVVLAGSNIKISLILVPDKY